MIASLGTGMQALSSTMRMKTATQPHAPNWPMNSVTHLTSGSMMFSMATGYRNAQPPPAPATTGRVEAAVPAPPW